MRNLTKTELRATRALAQVLMESGINYESAVFIIGKRLTYLGKFSIANIEQVFFDKDAELNLA